MSTNQRIALIGAALLVAVGAFILARPGGDDEESQQSSTTSTAQNHEAPPPVSEPTRLVVKGGTIAGDVKTIRAEKGDTVSIVVSSDAPDQIHLHGYDIEKEAAPGKPARFKFEADVEGAFELESHAAEDAGKEPLLARLLIGPS